MGKYETQFGIKMEAGKIYDYAAQFFPILGYRFVSGDKPNTISFTRGDHIGTFFSFKIEKQKCGMAMSLILSGEETIVKFYFAFATGIILLGGDKAKLDVEVERFRNFLLGSGENAEKYMDVSQKKILSEDLSGLKSKPA
jgi:hypothetical protein